MLHKGNSPDDADKLLHTFDKKASMPDSHFSQQLKKRVLEEYQNKNIFLRLFDMKHLKLTAFLGTFLLVFLSLGVGSTVFYFQNRSYITTVSAAERKEILEQILKANPNGVLAQETNLSSNINANTGDSKAMVASGLYGSFKQDTNFGYYKTEITTGPAAKRCSLFNYSEFSTIYEAYEYYGYENQADTTNTSFYGKSISYDKDHNITQYTLTTQEGNLEYLGGKYAVLFKIQEASSTGDMIITNEEVMVDPVTSPETIDDYIQFYFGEAIELEKVVEGGKVVAYIITSEYEGGCDLYTILDESYEPVKNDNKTFITRTWVDADSLTATKSEEYIDSISQENLAISTEFEIENKQVDSFAEVEDLFQFDYDVEIREFSYNNLGLPEPSEFAKKLNGELDDIGNSIIFPSDSSSKLVYVYSDAMTDTTNYFSYYSDRDFYPQGVHGDELFNLNNASIAIIEETAITQLTLEFTQGLDSSNAVNIFKTSTDEKSIVEYLAFFDEEKDNVTSSSATVSIDGNTVPATKYISTIEIDEAFTIDPQTGEEVQTESSYIEEMIFYIFSYKGQKYAVSANDELMDFVSYNLTDETQKQKVLDLIVEGYKIQYNAYDETVVF